MSRDPQYQKLLNSKRWKELRAWYLRAHPLCERCEREGYVTAAVDVHHKHPISASMTEAEMISHCFSVSNLEALCVPCHVKTHRELGKNTKANMAEREAARMARWREKIEAMSASPTPEPLPGVFISEGK